MPDTDGRPHVRRRHRQHVAQANCAMTVKRPAMTTKHGEIHASSGHRIPYKFILAAILSFALWAYVLEAFCCGADQDELRKEYFAEVPLSVSRLSLGAFTAVLLMNLLQFGQRGQSGFRFTCNTLLLYVHAITVIPYLLMCLGATPLRRSAVGRLYHPIRFILWAHTTPFMIYLISLVCETSPRQLGLAIVYDIIMMLTGLMARWTTGYLQAVSNFLTFASFFVVLYYFYLMFFSAMQEPGTLVHRHTVMVLFLSTAFMWTVFPVVYLAAEGHVISLFAEKVAWSLCDFFAKAIYSSLLWNGNLLSLAQRRALALQAWEETNRQDLLAKLQASVASKEQLLEALSHSMRQPIQNIIALTSLVRESSHQPARTRHVGISRSGLVLPAERPVAMIRSSGQCLLNTLNSVVDDLADPEGDGTHLVVLREPLALAPHIADIISLLAPLANEGVVLESSCSVDLPPVLADPTRLRRVFINLIGNALKLTHSGYVRVEARLMAAANDDQVNVEISVTDTGVGINPAKLASLFEPFKQKAGTPTSDSLESAESNLHLYLVKAALKALGTDITASSLEGHGTSFRFCLPMAPPSTAALGSDGSFGSDGSRHALRDACPSDEAIGEMLLRAQQGQRDEAPSQLPSLSAPQLVLPGLDEELVSEPRGPSPSSPSQMRGRLASSGSPSPRITTSPPRSSPGPILFKPPASSRLARSGPAVPPSSPERKPGKTLSCSTLLDSPRQAASAGVWQVAMAKGDIVLDGVLLPGSQHNSGPLAAATRLPGVQEALSAVQPLSTAELEELGPLASRGCHRMKFCGQIQILCIDNDALCQTNAAQMAKQMKWSLYKAMDRTQAFALLKNGGACLPDAILLDSCVSGISGLEVCRQVCQLVSPRLVPIIMLTTTPETCSIVDAKACGAVDVVEKPYQWQDLCQRIMAQVELRDPTWQQVTQFTVRERLHPKGQDAMRVRSVASDAVEGS